MAVNFVFPLLSAPLNLISVCTNYTGQANFALPVNPGRMKLEQGAWQVVELSAKSNGNEWGERAAQGKQHMLAFLFSAPDKAPLNASSCRDGVLKAENAEAAVQNRASMRSTSGVEIALAVLLAPKEEWIETSSNILTAYT